MIFRVNFLFVGVFLSLCFLSCKQRGCSNSVQEAPNSFNFDDYYRISSSFDENNRTLIVKLKMDPNLHAYAKGEKIGKPLALKIGEKNGWRPDGEASIPIGSVKDLGPLGQSVVLDGEVVISQRLILGQGAGEATFFYQVCSQNMCDSPRSHLITWP